MTFKLLKEEYFEINTLSLMIPIIYIFSNKTWVWSTLKFYIN